MKFPIATINACIVPELARLMSQDLGTDVELRYGQHPVGKHWLYAVCPKVSHPYWWAKLDSHVEEAGEDQVIDYFVAAAEVLVKIIKDFIENPGHPGRFEPRKGWIPPDVE
jgi:hypothetical protein